MTPGGACRNCGAELAGPWCHACGQHASAGRLHLGELAGHALNALLGVDAALPRTVRDLTLRPGAAARDYVEGKRKRYVSPVQYFLTAVALVFVVFALRGVSPSALAPMRAGGTGVPEIEDAIRELLRLMDSHMQFLIFTSIPFFAWSARILQRRGDTFAESCVLFLYAVAHGAVLGTVPRVILGLGTPGLNVTLALAGMAYYAWAARGFYRCGWIRALLTIALGYVAWILLVSFEVAVVMGIAVGVSRR